MSEGSKPLVWLGEKIKTPPLSAAARMSAGVLLRRLQRGETLSLPQSRPMPSIGPRCHEARIDDRDRTWRIFYRTDPDALLILVVTDKTTQKTPKAVLELCKRRLAKYDRDQEVPSR